MSLCLNILQELGIKLSSITKPTPLRAVCSPPSCSHFAPCNPRHADNAAVYEHFYQPVEK